MEIRETLYQIIDEVRSMRERFERSREEQKNLLLEIKDEINTVNAELRAMRNDTDNEFKLLPNMPFDSLIELREFDEELPREDALRTELKTFLKRFLNREFTVFLSAALRAIVTDELAMSLDWSGTAEKPGVQTFAVFVILRDICHAKFVNASHADINRICQQHFTHTKDRVTKNIKPIEYISVPSFPVKKSLPSSATELLPSLPISDVTELEELNEKLLNDEEVKTALKKVVCNIHTRDYSIFIRSAFRKLITDNLAMGMSWSSTKEKPSIKDYIIYTVIRDSCIEKFNSSDAEVNQVCQQYFLHAKDRVNRK